MSSLCNSSNCVRQTPLLGLRAALTFLTIYTRIVSVLHQVQFQSVAMVDDTNSIYTARTVHTHTDRKIQ